MLHIDTIVIQDRPRLDEAAATFLARKCGRRHWPGIDQAKIQFCPAGYRPTECNANEAEQQGALYLGVGGGRFDQHTYYGQPGRDGQSATSLVAEFLRVSIKYKRLVKYVTDQEANGDKDEFRLARIMTLVGQQFENDPRLMLNWAWVAIDAIMAQDIGLHDKAKQILSVSQSYSLGTDPASGQAVRMVVVETDEFEFERHAFRSGYRIVVVRASSGHVSIFIKRSSRFKNESTLDLTPVAVAIRHRETHLRNKAPWPDEWLAGETGPDECSEWYFDAPTGRLLNGGKCAPNVPPTKIPPEEIVTILVAVLGTQLTPALASR